MAKDTLELSLLEGLYLMERGTIQVKDGKKKSTREDIGGKTDEEDFFVRYAVYNDLRERGYVVKTGFKFGAHFRLYERGGFDKTHSKHLVHAVREDHPISFPEISRAIRLTSGVKKTLIFAVVDDEGGITYFSMDRMIP